MINQDMEAQVAKFKYETFTLKRFIRKLQADIQQIEKGKDSPTSVDLVRKQLEYNEERLQSIETVMDWMMHPDIVLRKLKRE